MEILFSHIKKALSIFSIMLFFCSCATYNSQINKYYTFVQQQDYTTASKQLDHIRLLKRKRNQFLYFVEKGKILHNLKLYDSSNIYFNKADNFIEDNIRLKGSDIAAGTLLNPMMETYLGEDFEKFMIHYYKALNYLYLNNRAEALVEARRIDLQNNQQDDKYKQKNNRYGKDAFSLILEGLIYEASNDINNAFISYRNAVDVYLDHQNSYYGVLLPEELKQSLLRTAFQNGFMSELSRYEKLLNLKYNPTVVDSSGGSLILFWENGLAPIKQEQNFFFSLIHDNAGFFFVDNVGQNRIPLQESVVVDAKAIQINKLQTFRVAFPKYEEQIPKYNTVSITVNGTVVKSEEVENINSLAFDLLHQRFVKEMTTALSRLAVKKIAELAAKPKAGDKDKDFREGLAIGLDAFSLFSEKADTRNWQTLPHTINYARIPLKMGNNQIEVEFLSKMSKKKIQLSIQGTGVLQFYNTHTIQ